MGLRASIPPNFYLGCAEETINLKTDETLQELVTKNFNLITPQNALKLGRVGKTSDHWNFDDADWLIDFADRHHLKVRGHLMLWARSIPGWLRDMEDYQFQGFIKQYIFETLRRYPQITDWDICGEAYDDNGTLRETILSALIGDNWIHQALIWAREARPDVNLFYSDFMLHRPHKQQAILNLIEDCRSNLIPLDGISVQLHHNVAGVFKLFRLKQFIKKIQLNGLSVHFSEVTLWNQVTVKSQLCQLSQAVAYSELLRLSRESGVSTFNLWGSADRYSWRFPDKEPFLFDSDYQPKAAYHAILAGLNRLNEVSA